MNSDFFSLESILKLLGILLLVALGGGALATVVGALVYNVIAPVVYYIFGTEIFIGSISIYDTGNSGIAAVIAYIIPGIILIVVAIFILVGGGGLAALVPLIGLVGLGIAGGMFADEQSYPGSKSTHYINYLTEGNYLEVYDQIGERSNSNNPTNFYYLPMVAISAAISASPRKNLFLHAVKIGAFNPLCSLYWRNVDMNVGISAEGLKFIVQHGARRLSARQFREQCKSRYFEYDTDSFKELLKGYSEREVTVNSDVFVEFWRLGYFLTKRDIDYALKKRKSHLSDARSQRDTKREDNMIWIIELLEYLKDDPESRQQALLVKWG